MADAMGNSFLVIVLPLYVASGAVTGPAFGLSKPMIAGLVLALFGIASSIAQPFAGRLSDRLGRRRVFVVGGLILFTFANLAFVWAFDYATLFGLRILQGAAAALTITASIALVNEMSQVDSRGGNMGVYNSFRLVGFGAGPLLASVLIEGGPYQLPGLSMTITGFEGAFYIAAASALVSACLVVWLVDDPEETQPTDRALAIAIRDATGRNVLDPIFALGMATLVMAACIAMLSTLEPEVNQRLDQGPVLFSIEFVALIVALAISQPLIGRMSDERGRKTFVVVGLLALIPTTLVQGFLTTPTEMIIARAAQGLAAALVFAPALALAGDLAERGQSGAQLSVLTVSFGLGISAGQLLAGFFVGFGFAVPFAIGAGLAGVGAALVASEVVEPSRTPADG
jgi:MFS family permease